MYMMVCLLFLGGFSAFAVSETTTTTTTTTESATSNKVDPKEIQKALTAAGFYKGSIDGVAGKKTKEAITKFQEANNLKADGVVGPKTWEQLKTHLEETPAVDSSSVSATSDVASTVEETTAEATPQVDESSYEAGYSEYDTTAQDENSELKQKLVS